MRIMPHDYLKGAENNLLSNETVRNQYQKSTHLKPPSLSEQTSLDGCLKCEAGYYCPETNQTSVDKTTHKCRAGFYCESGSKTPDPVTCPVGHMCPEGQGQVRLGVGGGVSCFFGGGL